jgi:hypothetical protein
MATPRRSAWLGCVATALTIAACTDRDAQSLAAPQASAQSSSESPLPGDTSIALIAIDPRLTASYQIPGGHRLWVQEGGLCDPASSYGVGTWDDACSIASGPVLVTVKSWTDAQAHAHLDFSPDLRFAPLDARRASAELYLKDRAALSAAAPSILYCNAAGCVDESLSDPSMVTIRDRQQGYLYRRIKHFSGYQVSTGRDEGTTPQDSTLVP